MIKLLKISQLVEITGLSKATIYRRISNGEFPSQVRLSARRVGWKQSEIEDWLDSLS
nr:AlpA family phage regulatory protein [Thiomicrospira sp. WB1]